MKCMRIRQLRRNTDQYILRNIRGFMKLYQMHLDVLLRVLFKTTFEFKDVHLDLFFQEFLLVKNYINTNHSPP